MSEQRVYENFRFRDVNAFAGIVVFAVFYVVPGIILGRYFGNWVGFVLMAVGAALLVVFAWRCLYPVTLVADRDGIRMRCPLPGRLFASRSYAKFQQQYSDAVALGYDKIHEAAWRESRPWARRILGPIVFMEPLWFLQQKSDRALVIKCAGEPIALREDEFGDLSELADALRKHRVPGFADDHRPMQTYGGKPA